MKKLLLLILSVLLLVPGCAIEEETADYTAETYINGGYTEPDEPGVVYLEHVWGYACTGTLIAPTVVVTAKHCVRDLDSGTDLPTYGFSVNIGASRWSITNSYDVAAIYKLPGNEIENEDVAIMVLNDAIPENVATPYQLELTWGGDTPITVNETDFTIIGYGESVCGSTGNSGIKLRTEDLYIGSYTAGDFITQGRGANHGDSGGPIFTPEMKLVGVTSRGSDECTGELAGITIGASIIYHLDFINSILEDEGYCAPTNEHEICDDGKDNDCNGLIDDACLEDGEVCNEDFECKNGVCYEQSGIKTCLKGCDPYSETNSCGAGSYCRLTECDRAICSPGSPGNAEAGELCSVDTDCKSMFCRMAGDSKMRCMYPCEPGSDQCMVGEVCIDVQYGCGGCIEDDFGGSGLKNTGEPCDGSSECISGLCVIIGEMGYCSDSCSSDTGCIAGYHCDGARCIKGDRGAIGDTCMVDGDCDSGLKCVDGNTGMMHCASDCSDGTTCPTGFECYSASGGKYCLSYFGAVGDSCLTKQCESDLICSEVESGDYRCLNFCNRSTASECESYTACMNLNGYTYCVPMEISSVDTDNGGGGLFDCSQNPSGRGMNHKHGLFIMFLIGLAVYRRRI